MPTTAVRPALAQSARVLLPFRHMRWHGQVAGLVGAFVPASVTALALAYFNGDLRPIVGAVIATVVVIAIGVWRLIGFRLVLDGDGLRYWGPVAQGRRVMKSQVVRAVDLLIFSEERLQSDRQLFLVDAAGKTLVRMNGMWWSDDQLAAVAQHFEVPLDTIPETMTARELRRIRAVQLQWFERHPVLGFLIAAFLVSGGSAVIGAATTAAVHGH